MKKAEILVEVLPRDIEKPLLDILGKITPDKLDAWVERSKYLNSHDDSTQHFFDLVQRTEAGVLYSFSKDGERIQTLPKKLWYYITHIQANAFSREDRCLSIEEKKELSVIVSCIERALCLIQASAKQSNPAKEQELTLWYGAASAITDTKNGNAIMQKWWNKLYDKLIFWRKPWYKP